MSRVKSSALLLRIKQGMRRDFMFDDSGFPLLRHFGFVGALAVLFSVTVRAQNPVPSINHPPDAVKPPQASAWEAVIIMIAT
jgi:hypothetical protein